MSIMDYGPAPGKHCFTYCGDDFCDCERHPRYAQAIEARSGETGSEADGLDPKDESAVPKGCAHPTSSGDL